MGFVTLKPSYKTRVTELHHQPSGYHDNRTGKHGR
jgi:hypothetical protein